MPFSIGSNRSRSSSTSSSTAYGYSGGASQSRDVATSGSESRSSGSSFGRTTQSLAFADLFQMLYGGSLGAAGRVAAQGDQLPSVAQTLFDRGTSFLGSLSGGQGQAYLEDRLSARDGILEDQLGGLQEDVGRFFEEELLPGVTDSAIRAGQLGGGRQGVAQGRAIDTAAREFRRGATELRLADRAARDQVAAQAAEIQQAGAATGLQALPGLFGLREAGAGAALSPFERLASIFGGPTVLTESEQGSEQVATSDAFSIAEAIANSFNFGEDYARSRSQSSSSGKGFSFGIG